VPATRNDNAPPISTTSERLAVDHTRRVPTRDTHHDGTYWRERADRGDTNVERSGSDPNGRIEHEWGRPLALTRSSYAEDSETFNVTTGPTTDAGRVVFSKRDKDPID
jgi:hypothetical protein